MSVRLFYGYLPFRDDDEIPPDTDTWAEAPKPLDDSVLLTRMDDLWREPGEIQFEVAVLTLPLNEAELAKHRCMWFKSHEAYALPVEVVNAAPRRFVGGARRRATTSEQRRT